MGNFIFRKLSQKKVWIPLSLLFIIVLMYAMYAYIVITQNLRSMAALPDIEYYPAYPTTNATKNSADLIKRGEYLTKAGDCIACHTNTALKEKAQPFAGGLKMITPFGTIYTPNISPDKDTGIGRWTQAAFDKAMTQGIAPSGHYYYPAFPFMYFNRLTPDDLKAIKAYLDAIPGISQKNTDNEMMFPFNIRFLQLGWRILFFHGDKLGYQQNAQHDAQWNRGAYLVNGAGHCAMCHTPSYTLLIDALPLAAPMSKYEFTGAKVQGYLAPNISKSNIGETADSDILAVFKQDKLIGGGNVVGPMKEVNHDSMKYMDDVDLTAMAHYLKAVDSASPPKPKVSGYPGEGVYDAYCSGCHATGGGGAPIYGDSSAWSAVLKLPKDKVYQNAIHGINGMPAKGACSACSDEEVKQAVDYMMLSVNGANKTDVITTAAMKPLTEADGLQIYTQKCSACHDGQDKNAPKPGDRQAWAKAVDNGFYDTYLNAVTGRNGHPAHAGCPTCNDAQLKAAIKYMMQNSAPDKDYSLW